MEDKLDDEPNISLLRKKKPTTTLEVAGEPEPEGTLGRHNNVSNIPWIPTGPNSVHNNLPQTPDDRQIRDLHSNSPNPKREDPQDGDRGSPHTIVDLEPHVIGNNSPFYHKRRHTQERRESDKPTDYIVLTGQGDLPDHNARPEEVDARVVGSDNVITDPSLSNRLEFDDVLKGTTNSVKQHSADLTLDVSDCDVTVDEQTTSLILSEAGLQTLLEKFQDVLQQANDLQRRNENFLHCITTHGDRSSCEDLERRITQTVGNLTHLEDRIKDGDRGIRSLEDTVEGIVHRLDGLCKVVGKKCSEQSMVVVCGGERHCRKEASRIEQQQSTNQNDQNKTVSGEEDIKLDAEYQRRAEGNKRRKYTTGTGRQTSSKNTNGNLPSILDKPTDVSELHGEESNIPLRLGTDQVDVGESRPQLVSSDPNNTTEIVSSGIPQESDAGSEIINDVHKRCRNQSDVSENNEPAVKDKKRKSRSRSKTKEKRRSESTLTLESHGNAEQKVSRSRSRSRKLKYSELGFKYLKTKAKADNRVKVVRHEVVLRGGASPDLVDSNIKRNRRRNEPSTKPEGARHTLYGPFFGVQDDSELFNLHSDMSALRVGSSLSVEDTLSSMRWAEKAKAESQKGSYLAPHRGKGPDTVLLLDTSESMRGQPFNEMIHIAKQIIDGIQGVRMRLGIEENIGIAVFGQETAVLSHLTINYSDLKSSLDTLKAGGPSPLSAGLMMGVAALIGNASGIASVKNVPLSPRIILISDGHATLDKSTREETLENESMINNIRVFVLPTLKCCAERGRRVFCVPVGDAKMDLFEDICKETKGRIFQPSDFHRLVKMTQAEVAAIEMFEGLKGNTREQMIEMLTVSAMYSSSSSRHDAEDIVDYVEYLKERETVLPDLEQLISKYEDRNMPPIGSRMRRGPHWKWKNQDTEGPGTVVGHHRNGMLWIEWDNGYKNRYSYQPGGYEVKVVDEPRQVLEDQLIAVGYQVKRGVDWKYGYQDGGPGNIGTVINVNESGNIAVRWPNGHMDGYRFGAGGHFDVEICFPHTTPQQRTQIGREDSPDNLNDLNGSSPRINSSNTPPQTMSQSDSNLSRRIESYLPSVEEMNRKNISAASKRQTASTHSEDSASGGEMKSSVKTNPPVTDYRIRWQYADSEGEFQDYPGNVNGKIEATYIKRPTGTADINMNGFGYRISFTKMVQMDVISKEIVKIRRIVPT